MKKSLSLFLALSIMLCTLPFGGIIAYAQEISGITGECEWSLNGTVLTVSGSGAMGDNSSEALPPWGTAVTAVVIENGVTAIGDFCFTGCAALVSVQIPESITYIGESAFAGCIAIESVYISDIDSWCRIEFENEISNPAYYAFDLILNGNPVTEITVPANTTKLGYAFYHCESLKKVTLSEGVKQIGDYAFFYCTSLESIIFPESLEAIGELAFAHCGSLSGVKLPSALKAIGKNAFQSCGSLESINIPAGIDNINDAFTDCGALAEINADNNNSVYSSADGVLFEKKNNTLIYYPAARSGDTYTVPEGTRQISSNAFYNRKNVKEIIISDTVERVEAAAFNRCVGLEKVTVGNGTAFIGEDAFNSCKKLKTVIIKGDLTQIGSNAFVFCESLKSITLPGSVELIGSGAFSGCDALLEIYFWGSSEAWSNITVEQNNEYLSSATVYCNDAGSAIAGDINGDGDITSADLAALKKIVLGGRITAPCDSNSDGTVDIKDFICLKKHLAG